MDAFVLDTIPAGFEKVLGVVKVPSGKWGAAIFNPITEVYEWLGTYDTLEEAADAYVNKKVELEGVHQSGRGRATHKTGIWYSPNTGKWEATIRNPVTKGLVWLGAYDTIEEAKIASKKDIQISGDNQGFVGEASVFRKPVGITLTKSGTWRANIQHPVTKALLHLGTYDTLNEAEDAQKAKKLEFERMFPCQRKRSRSAKALWYAVVQDPVMGRSKYLGMYGSADDAEEALRRRKKELHSLVSSDHLVVNGDNDAMEDEGGQIPILLEESEVVNANGELIGEFSRMDDELWLV